MSSAISDGGGKSPRLAAVALDMPTGVDIGERAVGSA